jgi:hypothetical protein
MREQQSSLSWWERLLKFVYMRLIYMGSGRR